MYIVARYHVRTIHKLPVPSRTFSIDVGNPHRLDWVFPDHPTCMIREIKYFINNFFKRLQSTLAE